MRVRPSTCAKCAFLPAGRACAMACDGTRWRVSPLADVRERVRKCERAFERVGRCGRVWARALCRRRSACVGNSSAR